MKFKLPHCLLALALSAAGLAQSNAPQGDATFAGLIDQVDRFDLKNLAPHPRLLLTAPTVAQLKAELANPKNEAVWKSLSAWLITAEAAPLPGDPDQLLKKTTPGFNIDNFRKIQVLAEDVENHIVVPAAIYQATGDTRCLDLARRWTLLVASWKPLGLTGIKSDDYCARQVLSALAISYDGLYSQWSPEEKAAIRTSMLARITALYDHLHPFKLDEYNNHPWFQTSGLVDGGLALADESPEADRAWRYGADLYFTRFLPLWGRDGDWHEGISYLTFAMKYICQLSNSMRAATGIDPFSLPAMKKAGYFRLYCAPPGVNGIYFNDTRPLAMQTWDRPIAYRLAAEAKDPVLQWYANFLPVAEDFRPSAALYLFLYRDESLPSEKPTAVSLSKYFKDSGWVVERTDLTSPNDVEFGFKSAPFVGTALRAKGHDHPDANNFLLNYLGKPLLVDSGFYDYYSSPHHKGWTFTGPAHNTLLVDGQAQEIRRPGKVISYKAEPGRYTWMEGQGASAYPDGLLKSWRRQILYLRPDLFVIRDIVVPVKPAKITWLLHGAAKFELNGQAFVLRNGDAAVTGAILTPDNLTIKQWIGFPADAQPERKKPSDFREFPDQSHLEFAMPEALASVTFVTVFRPAKADGLVSLAASRQIVNNSDVVTLHPDSKSTIKLTFAPAPEGDEPAAVPTIESSQ